MMNSWDFEDRNGPRALSDRSLRLWRGRRRRLRRRLLVGRQRRHGLALRHDGDLLQRHRRQRLVIPVALYAGNRLDHSNARVVTLAKECVVLVERVVALLGNEELASVGVRTGVGHRQAPGPVEVEIGVELILEGVTWSAH